MWNLSFSTIAFSLLTFCAVEAFIDDKPQQQKNSIKILGFSPVKPPTQPKVPIDESNKNAEKAAGESDLRRRAVNRKKWGLDHVHDDEYWFDERIHTLGNVGFGGALHAAVAPLSTKMIDIIAYDGVDIRSKVAEKLSGTVLKSNPRILDLGCGVGISTRALKTAFPDADAVIGVDTSAEMVAMAKFLNSHLAIVKPIYDAIMAQLSNLIRLFEEHGYKVRQDVARAAESAAGNCPFADYHRGAEYLRGNAEKTDLPGRSFDLVTLQYIFHEAPGEGRDKILREARRLLRPGGTLAVVDITTDYTPSKAMLAGEPYVVEYQQNIKRQIAKFKGFLKPKYEALVPGHVGMWTLKRSPV